MNNIWLTGLFLAPAILIGGLIWPPRRDNRTSWYAIVLSAIVLCVLTAIFDSLMISLDLFTYGEHLLAGIYIWLAPIEDFAYPLALVLLLPPIWHRLTRRGTQFSANLLRHAWLASRPISWVNTAFPFGAAYLLTTRELDWLFFVGVLYYLIPYNLALYGINDIFDYASDIRNPRKGGLEGALLPPQFHRPMLILCAVTNLPFLLILALAQDRTALLWIACSSFALLAYSVPGLRFKEKPFLDSLTSSFHFVSPALVGLSLARAEFATALILVLVAFFLWGMAAQAFGAVQDIGPDRQANLHSTATVLGARGTVRWSLFLWFLAGVIMLGTPMPGPWLALLVLPYVWNAWPWRSVPDSLAAHTNRAWRRFIWLNYGSGFAVTLVLIWIWQHSTSSV